MYKTDKTVTDDQIGKIQRKTNEIIRRLNLGTIFYDDVLNGMQSIIEGKTFITVSKKHIIKCDVSPFIPEGWELIEHKNNPPLEFDLDSKNLMKIFTDSSFLNANILDYLLARPELIPENFKNKRILFRGTIYYDLHRCLCIRYLKWNNNFWDWGYEYVGDSLLSELRRFSVD